jgi:acetyltransferase
MSTPDLHEPLERLRELMASGETVVDEPTGKAMLAAAGLAVPRGRTAATPEQAQAVASELGVPVAIKAVADGVSHKTEIGGVAGPLSPAEVPAAASELQGRLPGPLLVEEWLDRGVQCFLGISLDGPFGPLVSFGVGGLWVELVRDVAHRLAPVSTAEAEEMVRSLRAVALLDGYRGASGGGTEVLAATIARMSQLAVTPELRGVVSDIDVNPLLHRPDADPVALDCTIVLSTGGHASAGPLAPLATGAGV